MNTKTIRPPTDEEIDEMVFESTGKHWNEIPDAERKRVRAKAIFDAYRSVSKYGPALEFHPDPDNDDKFEITLKRIHPDETNQEVLRRIRQEKEES